MWTKKDENGTVNSTIISVQTSTSSSDELLCRIRIYFAFDIVYPSLTVSYLCSKVHDQANECVYVLRVRIQYFLNFEEYKRFFHKNVHCTDIAQPRVPTRFLSSRSTRFPLSQYAQQRYQQPKIKSREHRDQETNDCEEGREGRWIVNED